MEVFTRTELTESEFDRLSEFLKSYKSGNAMNLEELDGFFSALIAGPEVVMPTEYIPEVFGDEASDTHEFSSLEESKEILTLLFRHWNRIATTLSRGEVYIPVLLEDENGVPHGNDWARGFMRGVNKCHDDWVELIADKHDGNYMVPVLILYHEHDPNPELRPESIGPERREKLIDEMLAGLVGAYQHFRRQVKCRLRMAAVEPGSGSKIDGSDKH